MRALWIGLWLLFGFATLPAQSQWQLIYPGQTGYYNPTNARPTSDGGYIMQSDISISGQPGQIWKTDVDGNVAWVRRYTHNGSTITASDIRQTSDGGYIAIGTTFIIGRFDELCVYKLTNTGNISWMRTYGTTNRDGLIDVNSCGIPSRRSRIWETSDGGYIVGSCTVIGTKYYGVILKLNSTGTIQWTRRLQKSGTSDDYVTSLTQTSDGGYAVLTTSFDNGSSDGFIIWRYNSAGVLLWRQFYNNGGISTCNPRDGEIHETADGGFLVSGPPIFPRTPYLVKLNAAGALQWYRSYSTGSDQQTMSHIQASDGNYVLACRGSSGGWRTLAMKISNDGQNVLWAKYYRPTEQGWSDFVEETAAGGYIMTAVSRSGNTGAWILSMTADGVTGCQESDLFPAVTNQTLPVTTQGTEIAWTPTTQTPTPAFTNEVATVATECLPVVLPAEQLQLQAEAAGKYVQLNWTIDLPEAPAALQLQRSLDSDRWIDIARPAPGAVPEVMDAAPVFDRVLYYRLQATDLNGAALYSNVASVLVPEAADDWLVYPNPTNGASDLSLAGVALTDGDIEVELTDMLGRVVHRTSFAASAGTVNARIPIRDLPKGNYMLRIQADGQASHIKVVVR